MNTLAPSGSYRSHLQTYRVLSLGGGHISVDISPTLQIIRIRIVARWPGVSRGNLENVTINATGIDDYRRIDESFDSVRFSAIQWWPKRELIKWIVEQPSMAMATLVLALSNELLDIKTLKTNNAFLFLPLSCWGLKTVGFHCDYPKFCPSRVCQERETLEVGAVFWGVLYTNVILDIITWILYPTKFNLNNDKY